MGFCDEQTNAVFFADCLKERYPQVFFPAKLNLEANGIRVETIKGTRNVWARDYMPLQVGDRFVKFTYKTVGYDEYPQLHVDRSCWDFLPNVVETDIVLDGGNCQRYGDRAIITDIIFKHNPGVDRNVLVQRLSDLLEAEIIIIAHEPGDDLGHADGIVKWLNPHFALINDYSVMEDPRQEKYERALSEWLRKHGVRDVPMTFGYHKTPWTSKKEWRKMYPDADAYNPGFGYYINFLQVRDVILLPLMGIPLDVDAMKTVSTMFPDYNVVAIDCSRLSMEGGLMNCVTMNYRM